MNYEPDEPRHPVDLMLMMESATAPQFDAVTSDFLLETYLDVKQRMRPGSLVELVSLGREVPCIYRATFATRGLGRDGERVEVQELASHTIVLRLLPDYLRRADRFEMLRYVFRPGQPAPFHPNICPDSGAICLEIYPGEPLVQILETLHDLLRWRIRQLAEQDAPNRAACSYGRSFVERPLDDRPLFARRRELTFETVEHNA